MKKLFATLITLLLLSFTPTPSFAAELIQNFGVDITAKRDGTLEIIEKITYDFGEENRHGIFRTIPTVSRVGELYRIIEIDINSIQKNGSSEKYSLSKEADQIYLKIGDPDKTITGENLYTINYTVRNGIGSNYEDHDEIFWNTTGNNWQIPILNASATLTTDFGSTPEKAICFTGPIGSKEQNCDSSNLLEVKAVQSLNPSEGLTVAWWFPKDTFPDSTLQINNPTEANPLLIKLISALLISIPIILNFVVAPFLLFWYLNNKSKRRFGPPSVNFDFPKDEKGERITPAEAGSIDIHSVDKNDIIATIFDLAIRKYLKIEGVENKKVLGVFGKGEDYALHKLKTSNKDLAIFETNLMEYLFKDGDEIKISDLKTGFYKKFQELEQDIFKSLIERGFYKKNPKFQMTGLLILGLAALFSGGFLLCAMLIFLSRKLNGRTPLGDETDWKIDGLKIFLKNMKRHHSWQAKQLYVVEKYIPYAISLGFINEFMDQLKEIYPNYNPTWYSAHSSFINSSNAIFQSMNSSVVTSAPSSSSGFSGGGSSGGGGGGGGGGSW